MDRLRPLEAHLLARLVHRLLRQRHELLHVPDRSLDVHCREVQAKGWKLYGHDFIRTCNIIAELVNVQGAPKQTECGSGRGRDEFFLRIDRPIEV
jgi:hypothetical protein